MQSYMATFVAGCQDIMLRQLKQMPLNKLKVTNLDESSVTFDSDYPIEKLIELRFFTNIYLIISEPGGLPKATFKGKYFRLMMLKNGEPAQINVPERANLETRIKQDLGLEPNTHFSKNDFYLIERASGKKLFTLRLPRAKFKREKLSAGELRPEIAHILCLVAGIKAKHIVLDMFAGYGSIPLEAVRGFGCRQFIAVDIQKLPSRHENASIRWHEADARNLDFLANSSIDRVVTDPPWGSYEKSGEAELSGLYKQFLGAMYRVLKRDGIAVILSGSTLLDDIIQNNQDLKILKAHPILVSGKKAKIFKLQKMEQ
ncbi:hypothetical protein HYW36_02815 [Candidatus Saccharibacteria bacterium]|nr:hypothetical protein [Candidatus Saccharibacteria bacterium]